MILILNPMDFLYSKTIERKNKMEIFILPSGSYDTDRDKTVNSFTKIPENIDVIIRSAGCLADIVAAEVHSDHYMIIYDNESIDDRAAQAIPAYLQSDYEMIDILKKESEDGKEFSFSPRLFKKHIVIQKDTLVPENFKDLKSTKMLDGWILPHD